MEMEKLKGSSRSKIFLILNKYFSGPPVRKYLYLIKMILFNLPN